MRVLHLVPRLPPAFDGVGDYAVQLARHLRSHDIESAFLVADPDWSGPAVIERMNIAKIRFPSRKILLSSLKGTPFDQLILHYVGYGYARRGAPFWLLAALRKWRRQPGRSASDGRPLMTIFHELWASGRPWQSAFYLTWPQRWIVRSLLHLSDGAVTSTPRMKTMLDARGSGAVALIPIPSNVPRLPRDAPPTIPTGFRALIFGQPGSRLATLRAHAALLRGLMARQALNRLVIAGSGARAGSMPSLDIVEAWQLLPRERIEVAADLTPEQVALEYSRAHCFLSYVPGSLVGKATTVMGAFANGCPVILRDGTDAEPLEAGRHFVVCTGDAAQIDDLIAKAKSGLLERIGAESRVWSENNASWPIVARRFRSLVASHLPATNAMIA